jgi:transcriptional regulator GlxA family with amidase domain
MRQVLIVAVDGCQLLDVAGPVDVFDAASRLSGDGYRVRVATPGGQDIRTGSGLRLGADVAVERAQGALDTLLVAGGLTVHHRGRDQALLGHLRRLARHARRVASVCSGAELLAAAGLLDGRRVTTHWSRCEQLQRRHPLLTVEPDRIFVRDQEVATSAGVTAGMDLALALVEEDHGAEVARSAARWLVVYLRRPGGQSQFAGRFTPPVPRSAPLRLVLEAVTADPTGDHRIERLATTASMSERHLTRVFAAELRTTPARFVERVRVEAAREALELGGTVEAAARKSGFSSAEVMRRAFLRVLGVSPAEYRSRFSAREGTAA